MVVAEHFTSKKVRDCQLMVVEALQSISSRVHHLVQVAVEVILFSMKLVPVGTTMEGVVIQKHYALHSHLSTRTFRLMVAVKVLANQQS